MAINLSKGQRESISTPRFTIGLGWDENSSATGGDFDLDASAFILGSDGKLVTESHFIFYNNLKSPSGALEHTGDNLTGDGDGDDESIKVDLALIDPKAAEVCVVVTIHEAEGRKQNFGQVRNSYIRIYNTDTNEEIMKYELDEDFSVETAVEFGRIYKRNDEWKFEAMGTGMKGGLEDYLKKYN